MLFFISLLFLLIIIISLCDLTFFSFTKKIEKKNQNGKSFVGVKNYVLKNLVEFSASVIFFFLKKKPQHCVQCSTLMRFVRWGVSHEWNY